MPTRVQNKRHQINSLAVAAANAEIANLEANSKKFKSKAETKVFI